MKQYTCPECNGFGGSTTKVKTEEPDTTGEANRSISIWVDCFFCFGTGYSSEEDTYQEFWKQ